MRCKACDRILEEQELVKKDQNGNFLDLCTVCVRASEDYNEDVLNLDLTNEENYDTLY